MVSKVPGSTPGPKEPMKYDCRTPRLRVNSAVDIESALSALSLVQMQMGVLANHHGTPLYGTRMSVYETGGSTIAIVIIVTFT